MSQFVYCLFYINTNFVLNFDLKTLGIIFYILSIIYIPSLAHFSPICVRNRNLKTTLFVIKYNQNI